MRSRSLVSCRARCSSSLLADVATSIMWIAHLVGEACRVGPRSPWLRGISARRHVHRCADPVLARLPRSSTGSEIVCWRGCHGCPQARRLCAGKVATGVHRCADVVLARLPPPALCGSVSISLALSRTILLPGGGSCGETFPRRHPEVQEIEPGALANSPHVRVMPSAQPLIHGPFRRGVPWGECVGGGDCDTPIWGLADVGAKV